jgi:rubrerythrin
LEIFAVGTEVDRARHWTIAEIPYHAIDRERARADPYLLYVVAGASFIEITSDLYTRNLVEYFAGDRPLERWLAERWDQEEKQHGESLKRYVETVWPEFDWERAYRGFYADYAPYCEVGQLGPTRALELASRCVVETGTSTFYTALARMSPEPVLRQLAERIKSDERRHYNLFLHHYGRWATREGTGRLAVLGTLAARVGELDQEDIYCAVKNVFQVLHPDLPFTAAVYREINRRYAGIIRAHYPYRTAARMLLRPLRLSPMLQSVLSPLLAFGGWLFVVGEPAVALVKERAAGLYGRGLHAS